jgi:CubicO group peptidase (beta-lactamase class C family)
VLDEPVLPLVPAMRTLEPRADAERITPRHLLSHSAGLANPVPVSWIHPADTAGPDPDTFLAALLQRHRKLRSAPGQRSRYSNLGTLILGSAMATATGIPLVELVGREVLEPLGMTSTGFGQDAERSSRAATGYHPRRSAMKYLLPRWVRGDTVGRWTSLRPFLLDGSAYGGLLGPVDDAATFLRLHLRDGDLDGRRIVRPDTAREMRDIRSPGKRYDLGLGWFRPAADRGADPPYVEHLGGGAGSFNVMRSYPTRGVGAVVMGNATKYDVHAVARLALDASS